MRKPSMPHWDTVALVGVGLIGGSIGLALRERRLARHVVGIGRRPASLRAAKRRGAVTSTSTVLARGVADAELVIVGTPIEAIVPFTLEAADHCPDGALLTDVGSTKVQIVSALDRQLKRHADREVHFVGSHPLAGSEKRGPQHARPDLFEERVVVVTPSGRTLPGALRAITALWRSLGARVICRSPQAHDQAVAATSHVPHLVASALAAATAPNALPLTARGWMDTTRVAAGDVELWRQILMDNRHHVLKSLGKFEKVLTSLREALEQGDDSRLIQHLQAGKRHRDAMGN